MIYSQGAVGWSDVWMMTFDDRNMAIKVLNEYHAAKAGKKGKEYL